jgi:hypothetical protein
MLQAVCDTPLEPLSRHGNYSAVLVNFFCGVFLSGLCSGFVSSRRAYFGLVSPLSISVFSPVVRRGKSCSGNRGLGIEIRAENSQFLLSLGFRLALLRRETWSLRPPIFQKPFPVRH